MYRINLYPEYRERRRHAQRRTVRTGLLTVVIAAEAVLIVVMIVSGVLLGERAKQLQIENAKLATRAQMNVAAPPGMAVALELLQVRQKRLDWAPMLRAVGDTIDARLILTGIRARSAGEQGNARLELTGLMRGDPPDMQAVPRFMEALRGGAIIRASLPQVQLGAMEEGVEGRFKIVCQTPQRSESEGTGS